MKSILRAGVAVLSLYGGVALAQTATETTTTQSTTVPAVPPPAGYVPAPAAPPVGTLSSTRETHAVDAYGNQVVQRQSTYRNTNGVAEDSRTTTTTVPAMPAPPPVTTTTTTQTTSSGPQ
jgi:hypothetical protein